MARERTLQSRLALALTVAVGIPIAGAGTLGWRWYRYFTAGDTPYDDVGIEVNQGASAGSVLDRARTL